MIAIIYINLRPFNPFHNRMTWYHDLHAKGREECGHMIRLLVGNIVHSTLQSCDWYATNSFVSFSSSCLASIGLLSHTLTQSVSA